MPKLSGKNILITGASSGIGEAIAILFAGEGANVAINYHSGKDRAEAVKARAQEAAQKAGQKVKAITTGADVADEAQIKKMFQEVLREFGSLDVLINNSGIQKATASHEYSTADFDRIINVNLRGAFLCAREAIRHF